MNTPAPTKDVITAMNQLHKIISRFDGARYLPPPENLILEDDWDKLKGDFDYVVEKLIAYNSTFLQCSKFSEETNESPD